jgi:alcohol dehydrogenase class IV
MTASHMAGVAFSIAGLGICHAVGHPLSALRPGPPGGV